MYSARRRSGARYKRAVAVGTAISLARVRILYGFLVCTLVHLIPSARADTFTISYGKRYDLCRAYEQNLRSFPELSSTTHVWPLDRQLTEFRQPHWQSVDPRDHLEVIQTIYLWSEDPQAKWDGSAAKNAWNAKEKSVLDQIKSGLVQLDRARIDFNNDGRLDTVYRYYHPLYAGAPKERYGYWYLFFDDSTNTPATVFRKYSGDMRLYNSFLFRGRFYLIRWDVLGLNVLEPQSVRKGADLAITPVCIFNVTK